MSLTLNPRRLRRLSCRCRGSGALPPAVDPASEFALRLTDEAHEFDRIGGSLQGHYALSDVPGGGSDVRSR